jgi:hypothetical protein
MDYGYGKRGGPNEKMFFKKMCPLGWTMVKEKVGDAPLDFLMDSIANRKVKTTEGKGVGVRSLACNIFGLEGHARALGWGLGRMTSKSITHTDLHKPNNKLVIA